MLRFICFGSSSSGNCYFLFTENDGLLIDAGWGIRKLKKDFKDYGLSMSQVHHILITHDHADHIRSVGSLSHDYSLSVYATSTVHKGIERNYCVSRKIEPILVKRIEKNVQIEVGDFKVTPVEVPHDSSDNVGYKIEAEGITFCLMTDVGHVTDEMKSFIQDANYLVLEANHDVEMLAAGPYPKNLQDRITSPVGHLSNVDCGMALAENATEKLRHVWLCHLSEDNNHPELARKTVEQILSSHGIIVGKDFKLDVLKRKAPTELYELK